MSEQMRKEFEDWMSDYGDSPKAIERNATGDYKLMQSVVAWRTWKAAWPAGAAAQAPSAPVARALQKRDPVEFSLSLIAEWNEGPQDVDTWGNHAASQLEVLGQLVHESRIAALSVQAEPAADLFKAEKLVPYEIRYFESPGMAERLGYKVMAKFQRIAAPTPPTTGEA